VALGRTRGKQTHPVNPVPSKQTKKCMATIHGEHKSRGILTKIKSSAAPELSTAGAHNKCVLAAFFMANRSHPFLVVFREGIPHPSSSSLGKSHFLMEKYNF